MRQCLGTVLERFPDLELRVKRFYFHQPNKRVLDAFAQSAGLSPERVACNVDRYGNTSAAGMLILLAEDLEAGVVRLGHGDLVVMAAVGANVHYGAQLIRL
jgi:3-oxoacyl-[acyl-carrier-protein] synthase III